MFGENTWGSGVRSGSGCQQDDADTHQVGSKTCDQLLPWRIILGQICVSRWQCCRSWNRLLWDLQLNNITFLDVFLRLGVWSLTRGPISL